MKDRIPLYPGRVKLNPVTGQENTYDMVRADEPTQEGTPLNKASLLKDATAVLYGLGVDAVPNDILSILSKAVLNVDGNLQDIGGSKVGTRIATGSYVGTGTYGYSNPSSLTFDFKPKLVAVHDYTNPYLFVYGAQTLLGAEGTSSNFYLSVNWLENGVRWYSNYSAGNQLNYNQTYYYVAIG